MNRRRRGRTAESNQLHRTASVPTLSRPSNYRLPAKDEEQLLVKSFDPFTLGEPPLSAFKPVFKKMASDPDTHLKSAAVTKIQSENSALSNFNTCSKRSPLRIQFSNHGAKTVLI